MARKANPIVALNSHQASLVSQYARLARWYVRVGPGRRLASTFASEDDAFGSAVVGLCLAVQRYDPARGKFTPYACIWMRRQLAIDAVNNFDVRLPRKEQKARGRFGHIAVELGDPIDHDTAANDIDMKDSVRVYLASLDGIEREVMSAVIGGLPVDLISELVGRTRASVKRIISSQKPRLKHALQS